MSCACGLALLSSELSPRSACIPQVCYLPPFSLSNVCHPGKKIPSGSWHGKLNSCLNQQEAAPEDGCPTFGSNIALVIDRANSACPLPSYNLITYTLPRAGLPLPAGDVFILGCPDLESDAGLLPCSCLLHEAEPPCAISGPWPARLRGSSPGLHKPGLCGVGSPLGEYGTAGFTGLAIAHLTPRLGDPVRSWLSLSRRHVCCCARREVLGCSAVFLLQASVKGCLM